MAMAAVGSKSPQANSPIRDHFVKTDHRELIGNGFDRALRKPSSTMLRSPKRGFAVPTMDQALSWMREFSVKHERTERQIPALEAQREKCRRKAAREWNGAIVAVGTGYGF